MKKTQLLLNGILACIFLGLTSGCTPPIYFPNGMNAPLLSKKGQLTMNASLGETGTDIQAAASVSNKIGVLCNVSIADKEYQETVTSSGGSGNSTTTTFYSYHQHTFYEGGFGFYNKLSEKGRFEMFALFGFGNARSYNSSVDNRADYFRYAIQSNIGIENKFFEGIFSCRFGYLDLNNETTILNNISNSDGIDDMGSFFVDPAITLRLGWNSFKIYSQFGLSFPFNNLNDGQWMPYWASLGIQAKLSNL